MHLAEEIFYPIFISMHENVNIEKQMKMVLHLLKELIKPKKINKTTLKQNK